MEKALSRSQRHCVFDDAWQGVDGIDFSGRLTEQRNAPHADAGRLRALRKTTRMLLTAGRPGKVEWRVADLLRTAQAGRSGYWEDHYSPLSALPPGWHDIQANPAISSPAGLLVPDPRNRLGIISDIDDTLLVTRVLRKTTLVLNSLTLSPEKRHSVEGMAELYRRLLKQNSFPEASAVFYISCSPRQLTDNLRRFLAVRAFPRGVLLLRKIGPRLHSPDRDHVHYKTSRIEAVLRSLPNVRFVLFGDDAESDPEIYASIRAKYPEQIAAIYIRHLHPDLSRARFADHLDTAKSLEA
jgi:phosphatidate phosphatase APP1